MNLFSQINLLEQIHFHIEHKSTGTPEVFAGKLQLSERSLYRILEELKDRGVHIVYNRRRCSYEYRGEYRIPKLLPFGNERKDGIL
jgi:predicted DNA-binding transcriptional regulator YafY